MHGTSLISQKRVVDGELQRCADITKGESIEDRLIYEVTRLALVINTFGEEIEGRCDFKVQECASVKTLEIRCNLTEISKCQIIATAGIDRAVKLNTVDVGTLGCPAAALNGVPTRAPILNGTRLPLAPN